MVDDKYDILRHPNIKLTEDGGTAPYVHSPICLYNMGDVNFTFTSLNDIEIIDETEDTL